MMQRVISLKFELRHLQMTAQAQPCSRKHNDVPSNGDRNNDNGVELLDELSRLGLTADTMSEAIKQEMLEHILQCNTKFEVVGRHDACFVKAFSLGPRSCRFAIKLHIHGCCLHCKDF